MSEDQEHPEDIDFYRQKLAEKEQEIADLQTSMKKAQFKTGREIKEAKISEQHAKSQVRDEKAKSEKLSKRIFQVEEAKKLADKKLERALQQKQQYERESELIKAQYKEFKNEFKRCERVLPTQVFLDSCNLTLEGLNSYQELYYSLHEKTGQCARLEDAVTKLKLLCEETMSDKEKIVAEIKQKKEQAERLFKDNSEKLHDLEGVLAKCQRDLAEKTDELETTERLVEELREKVEQGKQEMINSERKLEQLEDRLTVEINSKEEEIRQLAKSQYEKYYNELKGLEQKYQENEKHLLSNLESIEESLNNKVESTGREKEKLEHQFLQCKEELDALRNRLKEELQLRSQAQKDLERLSSVHEQQQLNWNRAREVSNEEKRLLQKQIDALRAQQQETNKKLAQIQSNFKSLSEEKIEAVSELTGRLQELQQEKAALTASNSELQDNVRNLNDHIGDLNSRVETKPARSNSLHEIEEAMEGHTAGKQQEPRKRQESNGSIKFKSKTVSKTEHETQIQELEEKLQHALALHLAAQEAHKRSESSAELQRAELQRKVTEQVASLNQLKEVAEIYARRIDQLIKQDEVNQYTIKKLNEELLEEKNILLKRTASFEKQLQYQKDMNSDRDRQQEKTREKSQTMIGEHKKLLSQLGKLNEDKLTGLSKLKDLELKLHSKEKELQDAAKEYKQKSELTSGEIDRLQSTIAAAFAREKQSVEHLKASKIKIQELEASVAALKNQSTELQLDVQNKQQQLSEMKTTVDRLQKEIASLREEQKLLAENETGLKKQLQVERKDKAPLIRVPSLRILHEPPEGDMNNTQYLQLSQKQTQIYLLKQKLTELQQQIRRLNFTQKQVRKHLQEQCDGYIKQIIDMKMKVAQTQMLAEQKVHHYNVMKKKYDEKFGAAAIK